MDEEKKNLIDQYYREWSMMNQYLNDIDRGHAQNIGIFVSVATIAATILSIVGPKTSFNLSFLFFLLPLAFLVCFGFLSYQFRITAILRGHLARLEKEMNDLIGKDVYMWNSSLVETYMAKRNVPNKFLMAPVFMFIVSLTAYCFFETKAVIKEQGWSTWFLIAYWIVVFSVATIVAIPFFRNDKFRWYTYDTSDVLEKYAEASISNTKEIKKCYVKLNETKNCKIKIICEINDNYKDKNKQLDTIVKEAFVSVMPSRIETNLEITYTNKLPKHKEDAF